LNRPGPANARGGSVRGGVAFGEAVAPVEVGEDGFTRRKLGQVLSGESGVRREIASGGRARRAGILATDSPNRTRSSLGECLDSLFLRSFTGLPQKGTTRRGPHFRLGRLSGIVFAASRRKGMHIDRAERHGGRSLQRWFRRASW
jgi:hypothetical protein